MSMRSVLILILLVGLIVLPAVLAGISNTDHRGTQIPVGREEVVFWHFWGGEDGKIVDDVVTRFNESQDKYFVRAIAMPGNNLQAKLFLAVAGGDPPDLVNQDDPVLAEWAQRNIIEPADTFAPADEVESVRNFLFGSARRLSVYDDRLYGVCNGLDIRALYYNATVLKENGFQPPQTLEELDRISAAMSPVGAGNREAYTYLPDSRRLWAWGYVFGGKFYDEQTGLVELNTPELRAALEWMQGYAVRYGADNVAAFRQGDQSLPGKAFRLLPSENTTVAGRYTFLMDGQWRCRDILEELAERHKARAGDSTVVIPEFGVCPLPYPSESPLENAGWVNGNFFIVPRGAKNQPGAWEFMKFWIGYTDADAAAKTCADGGWIPVSEAVVQSPRFQEFLGTNPLFEEFVSIAASENQFPVPVIPGASLFKRTVEAAAFEAMNSPDTPVEEILDRAEARIQEHLDRLASDEAPQQ
ncbi:MAG: extracellular solute-binding protein [Planctomycetota bacterium]